MFYDLNILDKSIYSIREFDIFNSEQNNYNSNHIIKIEEEDSLININSENKNLKITESPIVEFLPNVPPEFNKYDNNNSKETEAETYNKEKNPEDNINGINKIKKIPKKTLIKSKSGIKKRNRKKNIPSRKYNKDNIIKKIIAKFFKYLIKKINNQLELIGRKKKFKYLPANFIREYIKEVKNEENKYKVDFTLEQLISTNIFSFKEREELYKYNIKILKSLKGSILNINVNMKFSQLFEKYLKSEEFNDGKMGKDNEDPNYVNRCKMKAIEFLNFFKDF